LFFVLSLYLLGFAGDSIYYWAFLFLLDGDVFH
jgi:hypothetical protein